MSLGTNISSTAAYNGNFEWNFLSIFRLHLTTHSRNFVLTVHSETAFAQNYSALSSLTHFHKCRVAIVCHVPVASFQCFSNLMLDKNIQTDVASDTRLPNITFEHHGLV